MKRMILLVNDSDESFEAREMLMKTGVPFDELPAHPVWEEIEYPMPALFSEHGIYKGLEEIDYLIGELGYGRPS